ncbi:hypothetical protein [Actinacidiphila yeochonensis]|uniref:hypothetical protein n=1 Tax=Actinacidiphila yeochonensis TaxID=89050 RepID=UPI00056876B8|nr:hypothetical protein [Actinacidiphila yeochonensis]
MDDAEVPPQPTHPPAAPAPPPPIGPGRRRTRPALVAGVLAGALVLALALVHVARSGSGSGGDGGTGRQLARPAAGAGDFRAQAAGLVVLDGVSGRVQVTADPDARTVSGGFRRQDGEFAALRGTVARDPASGGEALTLRCEDAAGTGQPCAGDLDLTVPASTGLRLRQTSGETALTGLGGDLSVDAASVRLTMSGLHPAHAAVTVASGSADLGFAAAPADLDLHAVSASVALLLPPARGGYAVTTAASSASVQVAVERDAASAHRVALTVTSGSLSVRNS